MLEVFIDDLAEGMILQEDVVSYKGKVLFYSGAMLTNDSISLLKKNRIKHVFVSEGLADVNIKGLVESDDGTNIEFNSNNIKLKETFNDIAQKETDEKFDKLTSTIKNSILNLNLNKEDLQKNSSEVSDFIKKNFSKNKGNVLNSILRVKSVDEYLYKHSVNVAVISFMIGKWMKYSDTRLNKLIKAALIHDIGKLKIPDQILNKPGKLTEKEFDVMKTHTNKTYEFLKEIGETDIEIIQGAVFHHEKLDGSGYPAGLAGNKVHEFARIISVADIFDAMTSERVYKRKQSIFKVFEMFEQKTFGILDVKITMILVKKFLEYYIGAKVILNDGTSGKIIRLNISEITKPLILKDGGSFLDMTKYRTIKIKDFLLKNGKPVFL